MITLGPDRWVRHREDPRVVTSLAEGSDDLEGSGEGLFIKQVHILDAGVDYQLSALGAT